MKKGDSRSLSSLKPTPLFSFLDLGFILESITAPFVFLIAYHLQSEGVGLDFILNKNYEG